jgi:ribosomal protein L34
MLSRCLVAEADGFRVRYLTGQDLIAMRRAVGRPKDLRRTAQYALEFGGAALPGKEYG